MNNIFNEIYKAFIDIFIIIISFIVSVSFIMSIYYFTFDNFLLMIVCHIIGFIVIYFIIWKITQNYNFRYLVLGIYLLSLFLILISQFNSENINESTSKNVKKENTLFENKEELNNYKKTNLENKIKILKSLGLTKEEVSYRLKNDMKFKELIKNGLEDFNSIYDSK